MSDVCAGPAKWMCSIGLGHLCIDSSSARSRERQNVRSVPSELGSSLRANPFTNGEVPEGIEGVSARPRNPGPDGAPLRANPLDRDAAIPGGERHTFAAGAITAR